ncbi:hypothetical protein [Absidia glauca]|uniref:Late embryogenesis abundant protein LEA-2 subgroup domain-containing protein n=1 Tax=Absidia glauca TaxID=4829 RepID=A0A168MVW0_ABSGL|nr:hypothetical protein [Absidia glauca]
MHPIPSHNPYQHYRKHSPTSYDDIVDPYRRHKSQPSDSNSSEHGALHSRTASDSSTSRLAVNAAPYSHGLSSRDYDDDPYAKSRTPAHISTSSNGVLFGNTAKDISENETSHGSSSAHTATINNGNYTSKERILPAVNPAYLESYQRANSYLPYSHHQRDPLQQIAPIYVEDERLQTIQGVGSMLQDNISVDMARNDEAAQRQLRDKKTPDYEKRNMELLELQQKEDQQRRWYQRRCCCGLTVRLWLYMAVGGLLVLFALLMYFLFPRMPTVGFSAADTSQQAWTKDMNTMTAQWSVNMTLDSSANWIHTWLDSMVVSVLDNDTMTQIGSGAVDAQWIPPRESKHMVTLPINIAYSRTNATDETITDLFATCGPRRQTPDPTSFHSELFNVTFQVELVLRGLPWSSHSTVIPDHGIQCPG